MYSNIVLILLKSSDCSSFQSGGFSFCPFLPKLCHMTCHNLTLNSIEPWEQQENETSTAFAAFVVYRDLGLGIRSTAKVAHELSKSKQLIDRWSGKWKWVSRCRVYDQEMDRMIRERHMSELYAARDRHALLAREVQEKVLERLENMSAQEIPVPMLAQMLKIATDVELRALGDSLGRIQTEITGPSGGPIQAEVVIGIVNDLIKDPQSRIALDHIAQRLESNSSSDGS